MRSLMLGALLTLMASASAADAAKTDPRYAFRTDAVNAQLPWYRLTPGVFPPRGSAHQDFGELVEMDFVHRTGRFRHYATQDLIAFTLLPYATVRRFGAEADLRDLPLGTDCRFLLYQDQDGAFTQAVAVEDRNSGYLDQGQTCVVESITDRYLKLALQPPPEQEAEKGKFGRPVDGQTRVWKGGKQATLKDVAVGDVLLFAIAPGYTSRLPTPFRDLWVGSDTIQSLAEEQRKRHNTFLKQRGVPALIEHVAGKQVTVALFGDPRDLKILFKEEDIAPAQWVKEQRIVEMVVANDRLRTYNPPVDKQRSKMLELLPAPTDCYGCSGERWVIEPNLMLEGFRAGRIVRLFVHPRWKVEDMPFGEGIYEHGFEPNDDIADLYPYRTDLLNAQLPWYRSKAGEFPPDHSAHRIGGDVVQIDAAKRTGRFRTDRTGVLVDFALPPFGTVLHLGAEAELADLPLGTHCWFDLHQDDKGSFTRAAVVSDDYTDLTIRRLTYRVEEVDAATGRVCVACQIPQIKNYQDEMITPPDVGRVELRVDAKTVIWKGEQQMKLGDLKPGDLLLANHTSVTTASQGICTGLWVGADTYKAVTDKQRAKHQALVKAEGMPAWIDSIDGKKLTILFFAGVRADFPALLDGDPWGKPVFVWSCDDLLQRQGEVDQMGLNNHLPESTTAGTYGCSGIRWVIETQKPETYRKGQVIRVFKDGWALPAGAVSPISAK